MTDEELDAYLDRLSEIEVQLAGQRRQLDSLISTHSRNRLTNFFESVDTYTTIKERELYAEWGNLDLSEEIAKKKTEIRVLEDEREAVRFFMTMRTR